MDLINAGLMLTMLIIVGFLFILGFVMTAVWLFQIVKDIMNAEDMEERIDVKKENMD